MQRILFFFSLFLFSVSLNAQSKAYLVKGGLTLGTQQWNSYDRDPLFKYHGIVGVESVDDSNSFSVFAQVGYHVKGSAIRFNNFNLTGSFLGRNSREYKFNNISLTLGGKKKVDIGRNFKPYYLFGIRGDYTISTNLEELRESFSCAANFLPFPESVRRWNGGATIGGGFEFPFTDLIGGILEFTVNPDFSFQYRQDRIENVINNCVGGGNNITIGQQQIRNLTFEITLGFRFLHIVEYID